MKTKFRQNPQKYKGQPRYKDYYRNVYASLKKHRIERILDIGTASGDFLYYMPSSIRGLGIDQSRTLIRLAQQTRRKKNLKFASVDFFNVKKLNKTIKSFGRPEAISIFGTLCIFPDFKNLLNLCFRIKPKIIYINDWFNPYPVDIRCGYRLSDGANKPYNYCWNIRSIQTVSRWLSSKKKKFAFSPYQMRTTLKQGVNPLFSWHTRLNGKKVVTNGLGLILRGYQLIIYNSSRKPFAKK
jgi:hypothetical protein